MEQIAGVDNYGPPMDMATNLGTNGTPDFADSLETSDLVNHFDPLPRDELANIISYFNLPCCRQLETQYPPILGWRTPKILLWGCLKIQNPQILSFIIIFPYFPIFSHIFPYFPNKITIFTGTKKDLSPGLAVSGILQVTLWRPPHAETLSRKAPKKRWVPTMLSKDKLYIKI